MSINAKDSSSHQQSLVDRYDDERSEEVDVSYRKYRQKVDPLVSD